MLEAPPPKILDHSSAGIHRTGMITNAFLRWMGYSKSDAGNLIYKMRKVTQEQVRQDRLDWGDTFAI